MDREKFESELLDFMPHMIRINKWICQTSPDEIYNAIPPAQGHAIIMLKCYGRLNMTQLAEYLMMTRQQLTKIIDALVDRGLVERSPDPSNRRHVMISLTDGGESYINDRMAGAHGVIAMLKERLTEEKSRQFSNALKIIRTILAELDLPSDDGGNKNQ